MLLRTGAKLQALAPRASASLFNLSGQRCALAQGAKSPDDAYDRDDASRKSPQAAAEGSSPEGSSYDEIKAAARRTGDAAQEWMTGSSATGSTIYKEAKQGADEMLESTKRAAGDTTARAREAMHQSYFLHGGEAQGKAGGAAESLKEGMAHMAENIEAVAGAAKDKVKAAVEEVLGKDEQKPGLRSARAEWEATRPEEQRAAEGASRKSQLLDEAHGDMPEERTARKDKTITPEEFYTRH